MAPVKTRMFCIFAIDGLDEKDAERFINFRIEAAKAPDAESISLISAHCRGNRQQLMNIATFLLEDAFFRQEKTVGSHLIIESDLIDQSG
jgi:general secretion pathway protein A